jgi:hypothetical protein
VADVKPEEGELSVSFDGRLVTYGFGELKTLNGADAAAVITAAWGIAENLAFPRRSYTGFGFFAGRHFATSSDCPVGKRDNRRQRQPLLDPVRVFCQPA